MTFVGAPKSVRSLEQRIQNLEGGIGLAQRRRIAMALVVVGQMLPEGVIKGGSAMALRYGRNTRFTQDLDAARGKSLREFHVEFEETLVIGWSGFTGRLVEKIAPTPKGVPAEYVMKPFEVKLDYCGKPWCTVKFELGHNEIGDVDSPEFVLSDELAVLFTEAGFEAPKPIPVMSADHQIAQKLHALTSAGSERARDLIDLQLLEKSEVLDLELIAKTCVRLFQYRNAQEWPPEVTEQPKWDSLYLEAREGIDVLPIVAEAVVWVNTFVQRIDSGNRA